MIPIEVKIILPYLAPTLPPPVPTLSACRGLGRARHARAIVSAAHARTKSEKNLEENKYL